MPTATTSRLHGLDTLRSLAILVVMVFHLQPYLPDSFAVAGRFGWMGVDLFFVLSGYLIGWQLLKPYLSGNQPSITVFYRRRAFRILPAYLFVVLLYFAVPVWREFPGLSPLWEFLTFTQNLLIDIRNHRAFSLAWSLCVEEHFYLVLPLLIVLMMRKPSIRTTVTVLPSVVLFGICLRTFILFQDLRPAGPDDVGWRYMEHLYYPTYTRLDGLVAGVALVCLRTFRPAWWAAIARRGHLLMAASGMLIAAAMWMFQDGQGAVTGPAVWGVIIGFPTLSLGLGLLVASSLSNNGWLSRLRVPGANWVAMLAYSLYLTHKEIAHLDRLYFPQLTDANGTAAVLLYTFTCFGAAALLYLGVERPFMMLRNRIDSALKQTLAQQVVSEPAL